MAADPTSTPPSSSPTPSPAPSLAAEPSPRADPPAARVARLDDRELAGQLLVISVHGRDAEEVTASQAAANRAGYGAETPGEVVEAVRPAGVILFDHNVDAPADGAAAVPELVAGLQAAADVPLLVAIDQEHGRVARLGAPFTRFPAAMALGASEEPELVRRVAAASASELAAVGINVNFAPVADVNTEPANPVIGTRSFGEDPVRVAPLVQAHVRGTQAGGRVAATVKHFPGHGDTTRDSHEQLPTVDATLEDLRGSALRPFTAAVEADVELVMPGHLLLPEVDADRPATLSSPLLQDLLRDELGFDGVVVSDSMVMGALRDGDGVAQALDAIAAGVDLVLMPRDPRGLVEAVVAGLADGTVSRTRVEQAVLRTMRLKQQLGLLVGPTGPSLPTRDALDDHQELAVEAAARAVTVLRGACPPPLAGGAVHVRGDGAARLAPLLEAAGARVTPDDGVLVHLWDGTGAPAVVPDDAFGVVTGDPYAAGQVVGGSAVLLAYGRIDASLAGLARALAEGTIDGRTPVRVEDGAGDAFPVGSGTDCVGLRGTGGR